MPALACPEEPLTPFKDTEMGQEISAIRAILIDLNVAQEKYVLECVSRLVM